MILLWPSIRKKGMFNVLRGPRRFNPSIIFPSSLNTDCASDPQLWHRFRNVSVRLNIVVALFWPCNLLKLYVSRFHTIAVVSLRAQNIAVAPWIGEASRLSRSCRSLARSLASTCILPSCGIKSMASRLLSAWLTIVTKKE